MPSRDVLYVNIASASAAGRASYELILQGLTGAAVKRLAPGSTPWTLGAMKTGNQRSLIMVLVPIPALIVQHMRNVWCSPACLRDLRVALPPLSCEPRAQCQDHLPAAGGPACIPPSTIMWRPLSGQSHADLHRRRRTALSEQHDPSVEQPHRAGIRHSLR